MKKIIVLCCVLLMSCAWGKQLPSVCDDMAPGQSVLCDLAGKYDVHLETVGDLFLVINLRAIKQGAYTKDDAKWFIEASKHYLPMAITPNDIRAWALRYVQDLPELILISPYLSLMEVSDPLTQEDKDMLEWWLDYNLRLVNAD